MANERNVPSLIYNYWKHPHIFFIKVSFHGSFFSKIQCIRNLNCFQ